MTGDVQLVCFDLGGVLMRLCDGWNHACTVAGVTQPTRKLDGALRSKIAEVIARADVGELDLAAFAEVVGPLLGVEPGDVISVSNVYLRGAYPGAAGLLSDLADLRIATACLSNTNESHWRMMNDAEHAAALPLEKLSHRFASHLIGARKPDPAIYEHVERVTGVSAEAIAFFDDLPVNVEAARRRGWQAFRVDPAGDPVAQAKAHLADMAVL